VVIGGITYFADSALRRFLAPRPFADWVHAFYSDHLIALIAEFDERVSVLWRESPAAWREAWAALSELESGLKEIGDIYEQQQHRQNAEAYLAEIREQYALL
jgi:hypothetical protein